MMDRPLILILSDYYLPGYKGGGSSRTLINTVDHLGGEFRFKLLTSDRDLGDTGPYPQVAFGSWQPVGGAEVFYLSPRDLSLRSLRALIRRTKHDVLYLNSFFSPNFTIKPLLLRRLGLIPRVPTILAPRGEFSPGALMLKGFKKRAYLTFARALGLYRNVVWQASSEYEEESIRSWLGDHVRVVIARDLPPLTFGGGEQPPRREKTAGRLKIVFLSRISRKKNLSGALRMLDGLKGEVQFDIYGPLEDRGYWAECQRVIDSLPRNVQVRYCGGVAHEQVVDAMAEHDLFFFPTLGENYGYVVLEALIAGCPVLLSDRTPWRNLKERGVGWDLPLDQPERFRAVLQGCVEMNPQEHRSWSHRARTFGLENARARTVLVQYRRLFDCALRQT
jgi:glycosyltransferase involved in cell wall biosynthesis